MAGAEYQWLKCVKDVGVGSSVLPHVLTRPSMGEGGC